jgi:ABC-type Zn uptake system ZnuABC Zn-binding protein ZnuA
MLVHTQSLRTSLVVAAISIFPGEALAQDRINVVATLPTYAAIAEEIAGNHAEIVAIARGDQDAHFVTPRPSFAARLQRADLFIVTGLDLELWVPALLDRAHNAKINEGAVGHVVAYAGIKLLDIPESVSRSGGDVHVYGSPHIHTDPVNAVIIAKNITDGLVRIDRAHADDYRANWELFAKRMHTLLFGEQLVEMLGWETLFQLGRTYEFWSFAERESFQGKPLTAYLGGWLAEAEPFRDRTMVCYHKNWAYFSARFRVTCAEYVEPKPGIPPTPGHVNHIIQFIEREGIPVLFAANFFSRSQIDRVAMRAGIRAVVVPEHVTGEQNVDDYATLVDTWVSRLSAAFEATMTEHP